MFRFLLSVTLVVVLGGVLVLGYLGFVPGVASAFGSDKPRDLGIHYTQAEVQSAGDKTIVEVESLAPAQSPQQSLTLSGSVPANVTLNDEELTALVADHEGKWAYYPVSDCQIRINGDGSAEASGILRVDRAYGYAAATGVPSWVVDTVIDRLKITSTNPPFYVKGSGSVADNRVTMDVQQVEIGRFSIPADWIDGNQATVVSFVEDRIEAAGIQIKSASFTNGALQFDGTVPEKVGFSASN